MYKLTELRCKEVINVCNGERLGFVGDLRIDSCSGKIVDIIIPRGLPLPFCKQESIVIPWCCIERIGEDAILVNHTSLPSVKKHSCDR